MISQSNPKAIARLSEWGAAIVAGRSPHPPDVNEPETVAFARRHGIVRLARRTVESRAPKGNALLSALAEAEGIDRRHRARLDLQVSRLAATLPDTLPRPIVLKGPSVARLYRDPLDRTYSDIDLMVPDAAQGQFVSWLIEDGWIATDPLAARTPWAAHSLDFVKHAGTIGLRLEIHRRVSLDGRAAGLLYESIYPRTTARDDGFLQADPAVQIAILAVHLVHHSPTTRRLIWARDFLELGTDTNVAAARQFATDVNVGWAVENSLAHAESMLSVRRWNPRPTNPPSLSLEHVHSLEDPGYLALVATVRELGFSRGLRFLAARMSLDRFRRADGSIDSHAARIWWTKVLRIARTTKWSAWRRP